MEIKFLTQKETTSKVTIDNQTNDYGSIYEKIKKTVVDAKLYKDPSINLYKISRAVGVCSYKVSLAINRIGNITFPTFINNIRNEKGMELLSNRQYRHYTIDAIGMELGFTNRVSFINTFKKLYGMTPHVYRRINTSI